MEAVLNFWKFANEDLRKITAQKMSAMTNSETEKKLYWEIEI